MKLPPYKVVLVVAAIILIIYFIRRHELLQGRAKVTVQKPDYYHRSYVHVCMAFDVNDIMGAISAINSIQVNSRHPVYFHFVTDQSTQPVLSSWIQESRLNNITYEIAIFDTSIIDDRVRVRGVREELANAMNYARFYYTDLFPSLHSKVLHIDSDVIVQADVFDMYATELKPGHVAAFSEDCTSSMKRFSNNENTYASFLNFNHEKIKSLHFKPGTCSFNVGVYVFNADLWREKNFTSQLVYWTELNKREDLYGSGKAEGGSQPPMMIVFHDIYSPLDPMWNLRYLGQTPKARYSEHFVLHGKLLHWNGPYKPWMGVAQFKKIWDKYYVPDPTGKREPVRKLRTVRSI